MRVALTQLWKKKINLVPFHTHVFRISSIRIRRMGKKKNGVEGEEEKWGRRRRRMRKKKKNEVGEE